MPAALLQLSKTKAGQTLLQGPNKRQGGEQQDSVGNTAGATKTTPGATEGGRGGGGDGIAEDGGGAFTSGVTGKKGEAPSVEGGGKPGAAAAAGAGGVSGRKGFDSKQMLRRAAARLTVVISETAVVRT